MSAENHLEKMVAQLIHMAGHNNTTIEELRLDVISLEKDVAALKQDVAALDAKIDKLCR